MPSTGITAELPAAAGAYALLVDLHRPLRLSIGRTQDARLAPGRYIYCGSAYGPGGIRARVGRHMRRDKTIRWHVDHITSRGHIRDVLALPGGNECELVARFAAAAGSSYPLPKFGSSDCRTCTSHLLAVPVGFRFA